MVSTEQVARFATRKQGVNAPEIMQEFGASQKLANDIIATILRTARYDATVTYEPAKGSRWGGTRRRIYVHTVSPNGRAVMAENIATGEVLEFSSINEAETKGGFTRRAIVACLKGKATQHGGYWWHEVGSMKVKTSDIVKLCMRENGATVEEIMAELGTTVRETSKALYSLSKRTRKYNMRIEKVRNSIGKEVTRVKVFGLKKTNHAPMAVECMSITTGEIIRYESRYQAEKLGGFSGSSITRCIEGKQKQHGGFYWRRAK